MREIVLRWIGESETGTPPEATRAVPPTTTAAAESPVAVRPPELSTEQKRVVHDALKTIPRPMVSAVEPTAASVTVSQPPPPPRPAAVAPQRALRLTRRGAPSLTLWGWLYGAIWSAIAVAVVGLAVGVYVLGWDDPRTNRILTYVPLPYGFVRYHPIWYGTYRQELATLHNFYRQQGLDESTTPTAEEIETILIRRAIGNDLAYSYGLWVTSDELEEEFSKLVAQAGSPEAVERVLQTLWGLDVKEYQRRVLRPFLLKRKLLITLRQDPVLGRQFSSSDDLRTLDAYLDKLRTTTNVLLLR